MLYIFLGLSMYFGFKKKALMEKVFRVSKYSHIKTQNRAKSIDRWLKRNHIKIDKNTFFISFFTTSGLIFSISISFGLGLLSTLLVLLLFLIASYCFLSLRRTKIAAKKTMQLEQFLIDLMSNLYANPNILTGMQGALENISFPLREEIENIIEDTRSGTSFNDAVRDHIARSEDPLEERIFLGFIAANEKGFELVEFIRDQLDYIRQHQGLKRYVKILSTGPKYTAYIIMAIPLLVILVVCILNKGFMHMLFSKIGLILLSYSSISYLAGFFIIRWLISSITKRRS